MKKTGFTLAELTIAISIIGIAAALVIPSVNKFLPDKNKSIVLKYNALINNAIIELFNNSTLYSPDTTGNGVLLNKNNQICSGIDCVTSDDFVTYLTNKGVEGLVAGTTDFTNYLEHKLDLLDNIAPDGNRIDIVADNDNLSDYTVSINTDGAENGCSFDDDNCEVPNVFILRVKNNGSVLGEDSLTKAYFKNPYNLNDKAKDLRKAKEIKEQ